MNKVVILGNCNLGYSWFVKTHIQGCELNGYDVVQVDYKSTPLNKLRNQLKRIKPKYIFTHLTFHAQINPIPDILQTYRDVKKATGCQIIHTMNDARKVGRHMGDISGAMDAAFVGNTDCMEDCQKAWNIPVYFCPYTTLCYDDIAEQADDLSFQEPVFTGGVGTHGDISKFIRNLQKIMKIRTFQTQSGQDLRHRTPELSASAKCILGLCTGYDIRHYVDVRPFQYMGTGAFMITRKFKDMDDIIPDYLYVPFEGYDDPHIVKVLFDEWKDMDTTPMRIEAFEYMQTFHSCKVRLENVFKVLEGKQDTTKSFREEFE